ncbi:MAG TPA: PH domain-containing protein [Nocardioidaceae bacterium]|nr:PH domain-containing protein [Nocardioidaceae bacterium]
MRTSPRRLGDGEYVVASTRTHGKALVAPVAVLVLTCAAAGFLLAVLPGGAVHRPLLWLLIGVAVVVLAWWSLRPFLAWLGASYTVTNRRIICRSGVLTRTGRDIPLARISDVSYRRSLLDRLLGCGTLVVSDAGEEGRSVLPDLPHVEQLELTLSRLLFGDDATVGDGDFAADA